MHIRRLLLQR